MFTNDSPAYDALKGRLRAAGTIENYKRRFRAAAGFPLHSQEIIDKVPVKVGLKRLTIVADLLSTPGLVIPLPNWMAKTEYYWETVNQVGGAIETMVPKARGENQKPARLGNRIPIYCTNDDFQLDIRELEQSRASGVDLDTTGIEMATRAVNERIEDTFINGSSINSAGLTVPGLLNAPHATGVTITKSWADPTKTGPEYTADVITFMDAMRANRKHGPWKMYIPTNYSTALERQYSLSSDKTIRQWLEGMTDGENGTLTIKVADYLPADKIVFLNMDSTTVTVLLGQEPTVISWTDNPGFEFFHLVLACIIPRISADYLNQSGIVIAHL